MTRPRRSSSVNSAWEGSQAFQRRYSFSNAGISTPPSKRPNSLKQPPKMDPDTEQ